jgi:hypothetical protein
VGKGQSTPFAEWIEQVMAICGYICVCEHIPSDLVELMGRGGSGRSMIDHAMMV